MEYRKFTKKSEIDKALNTLKGLLEGIDADDEITSSEVDELDLWVKEHAKIVSKLPFEELSDAIAELQSESIDRQEVFEDLKWLVNSLSEEYIYYDGHTADLQSLQGYCQGIIADGTLNNAEIYELKNWMENHQHLDGYYPYDEIYTVLIDILEDGVIDDDERHFLIALINEFCDIKNSETNERIKRSIEGVHVGVIFDKVSSIDIIDKSFVFTGNTHFWKTKEDFQKVIEDKGGKYLKGVSSKTDYLVVGFKGNPCWSYSRYGRKVEKAMDLRKKGKKITILNEAELWKLWK